MLNILIPNLTLEWAKVGEGGVSHDAWSPAQKRTPGKGCESWARNTFSSCGWQRVSWQRWGLEPVSKPTSGFAAVSTCGLSLLNCYNVCSLAPALKTTQACRQMGNAAPDFSAAKWVLLTQGLPACPVVSQGGGPLWGVPPAVGGGGGIARASVKGHSCILRTVADFQTAANAGGLPKIWAKQRDPRRFNMHGESLCFLQYRLETLLQRDLHLNPFLLL